MPGGVLSKSQTALRLVTPQFRSVPESCSKRSRTRRVQVPRRLLPSKRESWSFWGLNVPL